jgi:hypothetical protein
MCVGCTCCRLLEVGGRMAEACAHALKARCSIASRRHVKRGIMRSVDVLTHGTELCGQRQLHRVPRQFRFTVDLQQSSGQASQQFARGNAWSAANPSRRKTCPIEVRYTPTALGPAAIKAPGCWDCGCFWAPLASVWPSFQF